MRDIRHPHRPHWSHEGHDDMVIWLLIAAVVAVNALLMWRIATGGF